MEKSVFRNGSTSVKKVKGSRFRIGSIQENVRRAGSSELRFKGCDRKKALRPSDKRCLVKYAHKVHQMSIRKALNVFNISSSVYYYKSKDSDDERIGKLLIELAEKHNRWGFWMMYHRLRTLGYPWNHKKVYRVYTNLQLNLRTKHKKRLSSRIKEPLLQPIHPNVTWSMDFMHDGLVSGKKFRSFNIIDDFNREVLNITIDTSINSTHVIGELEKLVEWRGMPEKIRVDNGPEFIAEKLQKWCKNPARNIELKFIQKGKPTQNGFIERFNRTYRNEVLDNFAFETLKHARIFSHAWMWIYNNERPHKSLGYNTPTKFLLKYGKVKNFPTFQQDNYINWTNLVNNILNVAT